MLNACSLSHISELLCVLAGKIAVINVKIETAISERKNHWHCLFYPSMARCKQPAHPINIHLSKQISPAHKSQSGNEENSVLIYGNGKLARRWKLCLMEKSTDAIRSKCFRIMCSAAKNVLGLCWCTFACWYSRRLSPVSISLAYTIFAAYLTFLSKTKINENFSFREMEADEISRDSEYFFSAYLPNEIARIKIIFQIVDGEISQCWDPSRAGSVPLLCVDMKNGKTKQRKSKLERSNLSAFKLTSQQKIPTQTGETLPALPSSAIDDSFVFDEFPTWRPAAYLTNCTQLISNGENYYLTRYIIMRVAWFSVDVCFQRARAKQSAQ